MDPLKLLTQKQIDYCMECGMCTGSCPISREWSSFSPRQMIKQYLLDLDSDLIGSGEIWACLSCAACSERCPVEIDFPEFVSAQRLLARKGGNTPQESHHGMLQAVAGLHTRKIKQQRTDWARDAGAYGETGEVFYFVGCLPYFEVTFRYLDLTPLDTARSVLKLLNKMGIEPVISNDERCCGHDALWCGDESTFRQLAELNFEAIRSSGAKTVVFSCPEGYVTFKKHYPKVLGELPFEVLHLTEFLCRELPHAGIDFLPSTDNVVTYHDPCRLGRLAGVYDPPRQLLQSLPGSNLVEMQRVRQYALCCGTSAWMQCSSFSKAIQMERIEEAIETGARTLITACPKCQIHLSCALSNVEPDIEISDLYTYLARHLPAE